MKRILQILKIIQEIIEEAEFAKWIDNKVHNSIANSTENLWKKTINRYISLKSTGILYFLKYYINLTKPDSADKTNRYVYDLFFSVYFNKCPQNNSDSTNSLNWKNPASQIQVLKALIITKSSFMNFYNKIIKKL